MRVKSKSQKHQPRYTYLRFDRLFSSLKSGRSEFRIYSGGAGVIVLGPDRLDSRLGNGLSKRKQP